MHVPFRLAHVPRVSILSLCILLGKHAHAQVLVSTDAEYRAALANSSVTHIRVAQGSTIAPSSLHLKHYLPAQIDAPLLLEGVVAADGSMPVFDGTGTLIPVLTSTIHTHNTQPDLIPYGTLDSIRNLVFRNFTYPHGTRLATAIFRVFVD